MGLLNRTTPVEKAFAELDKATEVVARWQTEQVTKSAELRDLEGRIGSEVLADETAADRLAEQAAKLRSQIDVAGRTARAATDRVTQASRDVLQAYSVELKANADHLRAQIEQREVKTRKLLDELEEWEGGCKYVVWTPDSVAVLSAGAGLSYKIPMTQALRGQMNALNAKAATYEQHANGTPEHVAAQVANLAGQKTTPEPAKAPA